MVKTLGASESSEVNALVSKAFGYISPHSFFDDFPVWDLRIWENAMGVKHIPITSFGIQDHGKLVSHVGTRLVEMQTARGNVHMGLIGAVATSADARGKGYSTTLLQHAISHLEHHHCSWQILWGSEHDFYAKLGFYLEGEQARGPLKEISQSLTASASELSQVKPSMNEQIFDVLTHKSHGVKLNASDREWVYAHKTIQWFYIDSPFAFVGLGRGMDMGHIIHEFGGDPASLRVLLAHVYSHDPAAQILGTQQDLKKLGFTKDEMIIEKLCLARPTHTDANTGQITALWNPEFWVSGLGAC